MCYRKKICELQSELSLSKSEYQEFQNETIEIHNNYEQQLCNTLKECELNKIDLENKLINKDIELKQSQEQQDLITEQYTLKMITQNEQLCMYKEEQSKLLFKSYEEREEVRSVLEDVKVKLQYENKDFSNIINNNNIEISNLKQKVEGLQNKLIICMSEYIEKNQHSQSQIDTLQAK